MQNINYQHNPVSFSFLGVGEEVSVNTLYKMKRIINYATRNYYVRRWAEEITSGLPNNDLQVAQTIYNYLSTHTQYRKDPANIELVRSPEVSLKMIELGNAPSLDCDDLTVLSLSLVKSVGIDVGLRAVSYSPDKILSHVYGMVLIGSQWMPFDLVRLPGFGNEHPGVTQVKDMEV